MWKITENVYLAQLPIIEGLTRKQEFEKHKVIQRVNRLFQNSYSFQIKRVLTVASERIKETREIEHVDYKFLHVLDMPDEVKLDKS